MGGNNRYVYTIYGVNNPRVIFNNNTTDPAICSLSGIYPPKLNTDITSPTFKFPFNVSVIRTSNFVQATPS